jgi:hypothetical protein
MCTGEFAAWATVTSPSIWISSLASAAAKQVQSTCTHLQTAPVALLIASQVAPTREFLDARTTTLFASCSDGLLAFNLAEELAATPEKPAPAPFFLSLTPRLSQSLQACAKPCDTGVTTIKSCSLAASEDGEWLAIGTQPRGCLFVVHLASATVRFKGLDLQASHQMALLLTMVQPCVYIANCEMLTEISEGTREKLCAQFTVCQGK